MGKKVDDVYASVTRRVIADLEEGKATWHKPWSAGGFAGVPLRATGEPYKGINTLLLWGAAEDAGYTAPHWLTFNQARKEGGSVRKGERASYVFFAKPITRPGEGEDAEEQRIYMRRAYAVFNSQQCDGLPDKYAVQDAQPVEAEPRNAHCEAWFDRLGADVRHGGDRAYYSLSLDHIQMPPFAAFENAERYYSVRAHESTHWTGAEGRMGREYGGRGSEQYAKEELIAELGAAFLCASLGLSSEPRADHSAYIAHWLTALREDNRAIVVAATAARRAVDYMASLAGEPGIESIEEQAA